MDEGMYPPLPLKGQPQISQGLPRYKTDVNSGQDKQALLRYRIENKIDNILRKNQNGFRRNRSTTSQIFTIP